MKTYILSFLIIMLGASTTAFAQFDDLYYDYDNSDYVSYDYDEDYYGDDYAYDDDIYENYDYFLEDDYYYSNRLRRFYGSSSYYNNYDPYYSYAYNPYRYYDDFFDLLRPTFVISIGRGIRVVPSAWYGGYYNSGWGYGNSWNRPYVVNNYYGNGWGWRNNYGYGGSRYGGYGGGGFASGGGYIDCTPGGNRFNNTIRTVNNTNNSVVYGSRRNGSLSSSTRGTNREPRVTQRSTDNKRMRESRSSSRSSNVGTTKRKDSYTYKGDATKRSDSRVFNRTRSSSRADSGKRSSSRSNYGNTNRGSSSTKGNKSYSSPNRSSKSSTRSSNRSTKRSSTKSSSRSSSRSSKSSGSRSSRRGGG